MAQIVDATHFAAEYHRAQRRKSRADDESHRIPYINHPIRVAALLVFEGGVTDPIALQAALLHDTIEDTIAKPGQLSSRFGDAVRATVMAVTDDKSLPKAERKRLQIEHAPRMPTAAALVKLADKIDNLRDLGVAPPDWPLDRIRGYFDWAEAVVGALPAVSPSLLRAFEESMRARP
ncbi:MAG: HD domain-containing protein [Myxococcales bacterium]|nr:HD domain-containing protein [Myxococcales bacterium]